MVAIIFFARKPQPKDQEQATSFYFKRPEEQAVAIRQPHALQAHNVAGVR